MIDNEIMTTKEAAKYLKLNPETLRRWNITGKVKALRAGYTGNLRWKKEDLDKMLKGKEAL